MKFTAKGRYAVTAVADLAAQGPGMVVSLADISARQGISLSFLEQLFGKMRRAGLVISTRGAAGGYALAKPATDIRLVDITRAVDEQVKAHGCKPGEKACTGKTERCLTHNLWGALERHIEDFLADVTIEDVLAERFTVGEAAE